MKKQLFTEDENYTEKALEIAKDFYITMINLFEEKIQEGYSIRELEYILVKELENAACFHIIKKDKTP